MAREVGYEDAGNITVYINGEEVVDDKISMKDTPLFNQEGQFKGPDAVHITCHIFISITVEVLGKGKDYTSYVSVRPQENLDSLRYKVPFFRTFIQRRY